MTPVYALSTWPKGQFWGVYSTPEQAMYWVYRSNIWVMWHGYENDGIKELDWREDYLGNWLAYPKGASPLTLGKGSDTHMFPLYEIYKTENDGNLSYEEPGMMPWAEQQKGIKPISEYYAVIPYSKEGEQ